MATNSEYIIPDSFRPFSTSATIKTHLQNYVRAVFADTLRQNGFTSFNGEDLCWFRVSNHEVINMIYVFSKWRFIPVIAMMDYDSRPLYQPTPLSIKPINYMLLGEEILLGSLESVYSEDILVYCDSNFNAGMELFLEVLQELNKSTTLLSQYESKKTKYIERNMLARIPFPFMEQVFVQEDRQMYDYCLERLDKELMRESTLGNHLSSYQKNYIESCKLLKTAILGDREPYLLELEKKKNRFIKQLQRKGIPV